MNQKAYDFKSSIFSFLLLSRPFELFPLIINLIINSFKTPRKPLKKLWKKKRNDLFNQSVNKN